MPHDRNSRATSQVVTVTTGIGAPRMMLECKTAQPNIRSISDYGRRVTPNLLLLRFQQESVGNPVLALDRANEGGGEEVLFAHNFHLSPAQG